MAFRFATATREEISHINKATVPDNTKKATKFGLAVFTAKALCVQNEAIDETSDK